MEFALISEAMEWTPVQEDDEGAARKATGALA